MYVNYKQMESKDAYILGKDSQGYVNADRDARNTPFGVRKPNSFGLCKPYFDYDIEAFPDYLCNGYNPKQVDNRQATGTAKRIDTTQGRL